MWALSYPLERLMRLDHKSYVSIKNIFEEAYGEESYGKVLDFHVCTPETR